MTMSRQPLYMETYSLRRHIEILRTLINLYFMDKTMRYWRLKYSAISFRYQVGVTYMVLKNFPTNLF